jgi:photosystem II stability/assembly factor-like uncharacterized protein
MGRSDLLPSDRATHFRTHSDAIAIARPFFRFLEYWLTHAMNIPDLRIMSEQRCPSKETTMRNNFCRIASAMAACLGCLVTALPSLPAVGAVNRWTAIGPDGANVVALAIDPRTPSTAFAGTMGSGVLKSVDGGTSWATANASLPTANVLTLAIDPATPSTLFAGTDAGVFKTIDGGQSWAAANNGLVGAQSITVNALAIDPGSPATLYAATSGGVFKTNDGAASWTSINAGLSTLTPRLIAIDPTSPSTLYVGVDDAVYYVYNGVFKSTDAGTSWSRIYTVRCGFMCDGAPSVAAIAIDPHSPSRLYVAVAFGELVRTLDGGASWSDIVPPQADLWSLAIDPTSPATLYAGTYSGAVYRTTDAGDHWTPVSDGPLATVSINVIAISASASDTIYAGARTGIVRSLDGAQTWTHLTLGVRNIGVYPLTVDPSASSTIYASVGSGVMKTTDGGVHWADSSLGVSDQSLSSLVIDPALPSTLYAGNGSPFSFRGSSVYKSTDAGAHWAPASNGLPASDVQALAIAPSRGSTVYVGQNFAGVSKTADGGSSWTRANNGVTAVGIYVSALAVDPTNADIVYVATPPTGRPDTDAKIFKSTNGAAQWRQVPIAVPAGTSITSLAIDPATPSTIYAAYADYGDPGRGGVFKSTDSGETWTTAQQLLPDTWVRALAIDPVSPSQIYGATRQGVYRSADAGVSWTPINAGLPSLDVWSISIDRTGSLLRAATAAGLFEYQISGPPPLASVPVIEYFYAAFGHYFITSSPVEISALDNGTFPGWVRTGLQFNAYGAPNENSAPVCRFFSTAFAPKSTHFYTPFFAECAIRQADPSWLLESSAAFYVAVPAGDGSCAAGLTPVYRLYNNGQGAAPNHRYTTDFTMRAQMIAQGWVPEGFGPDAVQMCSPP